MSLHIMSQWQQKPVPAQPVTDEERHQVFSTFAVKQAQAEMPWLLGTDKPIGGLLGD